MDSLNSMSAGAQHALKLQSVFPALMRSRTSRKAMKQIVQDEMNVRVRLQFARPTPKASAELTRQDLRRFQKRLEELTDVLEVRCVLSGFAEAIRLVGVTTVGEALGRVAEIVALAESIAGVDIAELVDRKPDVFARPSVPPAPDRPIPEGLLEKSVAAARSLVAFLDEEAIALVDHVATMTGAAEIGHRCRRAYDRLIAFIGRNESHSNTKLVTAGRAFREGRLTLDEVCELLQFSRPDAVALLEKYGFARSPQHVRLTTQEKADIVRKIEAERTSRGGRPDPRPDLIAREVIATQRLERVDARPWVAPAKV
jgi:hypothetical protein